MNSSKYLGMTEEFIIRFHELSSSFFIQTALWEGHNQETLDDFKYMRKGPTAGIPVFLQRVHTDLSWGNCNIRMEYFGNEIT